MFIFINAKKITAFIYVINTELVSSYTFTSSIIKEWQEKT